MITADRLREIVNYDPDTGVFQWKHSHYRMRPDRTLGSPDRDGYLQARVENTTQKLHRLAWLYVHGRWPAKWIDHVNGNPGDNRITNLREATISENHRNRRPYGSSGFKGVCWNALRHKWQASIKFGERNTYLGLFETAEEAHRAYCEAARQHFGEFARMS